MDELLGVTQVAELLGVSRQYVHKLKNSNELPPPDWVKGREWMWMRSTIDNYARERSSDE